MNIVRATAQIQLVTLEVSEVLRDSAHSDWRGVSERCSTGNKLLYHRRRGVGTLVNLLRLYICLIAWLALFAYGYNNAIVSPHDNPCTVYFHLDTASQASDNRREPWRVGKDR